MVAKDRMILVTGASGFVGSALVPALIDAGHDVRCLVRTSAPETLPKDEPCIELSTCALDDPRGLRASLVGVDTVVHLASAQRCGGWDDLISVDSLGTRQLIAGARDIGLRRFVYLSHLGADRSSAFPVLRAKGIIEYFVRNSGIPHTIIRGSFLARVLVDRDSSLFGLVILLSVSVRRWMIAGSMARRFPLGGRNS